jgi:hypothetical protein
MISHKDIMGMIKDYNIKDEEWIVLFSDKLKDIAEQKKFSYEPFRIKGINIKKFAVPEYCGVNCSPDEKNCLIWGSHRSGKSTTYDALLYSLLDRKAIPRPSIGKHDISITLSNESTDIKITREYNKPPLVEVGEKTYEGADATSIIREYTGIDPDDYRIFRGLTLPQRSETDSLLQRTNAKEFAIIIEKLGSDKILAQSKEFVQTSLDEVEKRTKKLKLQDLDMAYEEMEKKQRISSTKYQISQREDYIKNFKSGELKKVVITFKRKPEIKDRLQRLENEFQQLWREEVHLKRLVGKATHKYTDKTSEEVVEDVLTRVVCPVCESDIGMERFQSRIKYRNRCPLCNEPYSWEILAKAEVKIEEFKKVEEWRRRLEEINQRKAEIEEENKKLGFDEYSHETIRRVIKEQTSEKDIEDARERLKAANELRKNDEEDLEKLGLTRIKNKAEHDELENKKNFLKHLIGGLDDTKILEKAKDEFEKEINAIFKRIIGSKTTLVYENGEVYLVEKYGSRERKRKARDKHEVSFGEKRALDFSIVLSLFLMNQESRYYNIDFIILDDVTEGILDSKWKEGLIGVLEEFNSDIQLVCTSYDERIKQLKFESEAKLQIQTTIDESWWT